jgi:hypothetical protein
MLGTGICGSDVPPLTPVQRRIVEHGATTR